MEYLLTNTVDPDQTPDLRLHCSPKNPIRVSSPDMVKWQRMLKCMDLRIYKGDNIDRKVFISF